MKNCKLIAILAAVLGCGSAYAQTGATLQGTVTDPSDLAVPNTTVELKSAGSGAVRTTKTTDVGIFRFNELTPGDYSLTIRPATGFKQYDLNKITLNASEIRELGRIHLSLGSVTDTVDVTANSTPVQTASSENASMVDFDQMANLTARGRDVVSMLQTLPGATFGTTFLTQGASGQSNYETVNPFALGALNLNGQGSAANYTIDGVTSMDMAGDGLSTYSPNLEAVAEVHVLATNYSAEFGRDLGGQVQVITKGGTSQIHGSANINKRHEEFNANGFFNNYNGQTKPFYRFLDTAYSIGGPVYIPKILTKTRNKVFFFLSQDYLGQRSNPASGYASVPTPNERAGDFSYDPTGNGLFTTSLRNPVTGQTFLPWNGTGAYNGSQNFAQYYGNFDPKSEAYGAAMLAAIPLPNLCNADSGTSDGKPWDGIASGVSGSNLISPGNCPSWITSQPATGLATNHIDAQGGPGTNNNYTRNYYWISNGSISRRNDDGRLDFQPTQKLHAFVHYGHDYFLDNSAGSIPLLNGSAGFQPTFTPHPNPGDGWAIDLTYILSPTIVNQLVLGYSWNDYAYTLNAGQLSRSNLGNPPSFHNFAADPLYNQPPTARPETPNGQLYYQAGFPTANFGGGALSEQGVGQPFCNGTCPNYNFNPTYTITENLSKAYRSHNFKFGVDYEWNRKTETGGNNSQGTYTFGDGVTDAYFTSNTGDGYANALLGNINNYTEGQRFLGLKTSKSFEAFAQDNWRATKRLTLDLGVRFSHLPAMQDESGQSTMFDPPTYQAGLAERQFYPYCSVSTATAACPAADTFTWDPATNPNAVIGTGQGGPGNMYPSYVKPGTLVPLSIAGLQTGGYAAAPNPYTGMQIVNNTNKVLPLQNGVYQVPRFQPSPRIGFALDVFGNGKTAILGGFGINLRREPNASLNGAVGGPPLGLSLTQNYGTIASIATNPLAGYIQSAPPNPNIVVGLTPLGTTAMVGPKPYEASYNGSLKIQQSLGHATVLSAAFVFVNDRHQSLTNATNLPTNGGIPMGNGYLFSEYQPNALNPTMAYLNQYLPGNASGENLSDNYFRTQYPGYGQVGIQCYCGSSDTDSLQVTARRNLTRRFSMTFAYTWLKTMSLQGGHSVIFPDSFRNWGPGYAGNVPMFATITYVYQLPNVSGKVGFKPLGVVTDNWELSGTTQIRGDTYTGVPTISFANSNSNSNPLPNTTGTATEGARMNVVGNWQLPSSQVSFVGGPTTTNIGVNGTPGNALINEAAFMAPNPCSLTPNANPREGVGENMSCFGNAGAGSLINIPGTHVDDWDMTLRKRFPIKGEKRFFELRAEAYNVFNHTQFLGASLGQSYDWTQYKNNNTLVPTNGGTGRYTSTVNPRLMSFALRFQF